MPNISHIAGLPSATEQRCVRCCEVIAKNSGISLVAVFPWWPASEALVGPIGGAVEDCKPVDLSESQPHVEIHVSGEALIVDHKRVADAVRKAAEEYRTSFGAELL